MSIESIAIAEIRRDGGTQPRARKNEETVAEYVEALGDGAEFPPVTVFYDGRVYWLADGFHRVEAHERAGSDEIRADVRQGERRDAVLHSVGANADHGLRRTNDDKRRAVDVLLRDPLWSRWSNREIARRARVTHTFVSEMRRSLEAASSEPTDERTYTTKHGTPSTMRVDGIRQANTERANEPERPAGMPVLARRASEPAEGTDPVPHEPVSPVAATDPWGDDDHDDDPAPEPRKPYTKAAEDRNPLDAYYTPEGLPEALIREADLRGGFAWEPHAGGGSFVRPLQAFVEDGQLDGLWASDINPEAPGVADFPDGAGVDFLAVGRDDVPLPSIDYIIGNPPYNEAEEHVRKALELVEFGGMVAFLLRLGFLESQKRLAFWREHPAQRMYALVPRPSFSGDGKTDGQAYAWFVWIKGLPVGNGMPTFVLDWRSGEVLP